MGAIGRFPTPNPRVLSSTDNKPVEAYLPQDQIPELITLVTLYLRQQAYDFARNWATSHHNFLPTKEVCIYSSTEDLIADLFLYEEIQRVTREDLAILINSLPETSWYVHPTYPLALLDVS